MSRWYLRRPVLSWALYDWATAAFSTTVMAGFFPTFFHQFWSLGSNPTTTTFRLGLANGAAGLLVALSAPFLGANADRGGRRKAFLLCFAFIGVLATAALCWIGRGEWGVAIGVFVTASAAYSGAIVFYDSLLLRIAEPSEYNRVSAYGYSLGYLGGGLLFLLNVLMTLHPAWFGLASMAEAVQYSFLTVAIWWFVFAMPLAFGVSESGEARGSGSSWSELRATLKSAAAHRMLWLFLLAYWLYIDGVNTIVKMAIDYGLALGLPAASLLEALLITQFVAFPAALVFGWLGNRIGARQSILAGLIVYLGVTVWAIMLHTVGQFYAMAVTVGLVQGGVQSLSRALFGQFVPKGKSAEYFGFYNMTGKFGAVLGPLIVGITAQLSGNSRAGIGAVAVLFLVGGAVLWRVHTPEPAPIP
ncbi:MAG: MFS transporter [Steroidobacteraceae bacterium]